MTLQIRSKLEPFGRDYIFPFTKAEAVQLGIKRGDSVRLHFETPPEVDDHGVPIIHLEILPRSRKKRKRSRRRAA